VNSKDAVRLWVALIAAGTLTATAVPTAGALPSAKSFRAQRLCSAPSPDRASCMDLRLVSKALTSADLQANAHRQAAELESGAKPAVTSKTIPGGYTPANLHSAYSLPTETAASATQTIGIVDAYNDPTAESDLAVYDTAFGLPPCTTANGCFRKLNELGKTGNLPAREGGWATEISLDLQMAHAICQNCKLVLVEAASTRWSDLGAAVNTAVAAGATVVSNSYGGAEGSGYAALNSYYEHPGVVITASSGDCGYYNQACGGFGAADFPAASPSVVAVGGTSLASSGGHWGSIAWNDAGGGCSVQFSAPAWQRAVPNFTATGCGTGRSVGDVSAVADPYTGVDVYDSTPGGTGASTGWGVFGGTSASSPIVAAEFALGGGARGVAHPAQTLYSHLGEAGDLVDVLSGSTGSCSGATACRAAAGYDGPTGVGSPVSLGAFSVAGTPVSSAAPAISGEAEQGQSLSAGAGEWNPAASSLSYAWALCDAEGSQCAALAGASGATFALPATAVGHTVRAIVTPADSAGTGTAAESPATAVITSNIPAVTELSPRSGPTGTTVTISGTALGHATGVTFGGLAASFKVISSREIEAVIPEGASPSSATVVTPSRHPSSKATFTPTLSVTGLSPGRAKTGTTVTIKGVGFTPRSTVSFHGVAAAAPTYVSAGVLRAVVPPGASTGPVAVSGESGTVYSGGSFVVAP
jgi:hypothetical protein